MGLIQKLGLGYSIGIGGVIIGATLLAGGISYFELKYKSSEPTPSVKRIYSIEQKLDSISAKQMVRDEGFKERVSKLESELLNLESNPKVMENKKEYDFACKIYQDKKESGAYVPFLGLALMMVSLCGMACIEGRKCEKEKNSKPK